jgi:mannose-6-phosphate isomerase-like protein (cupin superfamily)
MGTRMRLATLPTMQQQNENHRLVRMIFRRIELPGSPILAVEQSTYFATGRSPVHAESHTEEIMYFRRGRGKVLRGDKYVEVGPGSACTIPKSMTHHVVNSGEDVLEHILISVEIGNATPQGKNLPSDDCVQLDGLGDLTRLALRKIVVPEGQSSPKVTFAEHETVYAFSGGHVVAHVTVAGTEYEWQYALDSSNCIWLPPGLPHYFRNIGDAPVHAMSFLCRSNSK